MVNQDGDLGERDRFPSELINMSTQHLNQSSIICDMRLGAMGKEWKSQRIHR